MDVRFVAPEMAELDALRCEALALPFFADEHPPRGPLGLVDWRLCGFVSRQLASGKITGAVDETVLLPGRPKLPVDKVFLFGLGPETELSRDAIGHHVARVLDTLSRAGVRTTALLLPGRSTGRTDPTLAMDAFMAVAAGREDHDELILLEPLEAQRAIQPIVERERRRARARVD